MQIWLGFAGISTGGPWGCRLWCAMPNGMMTDAQVSVGDAENVQDHRIASVCKQTYDASCTKLQLYVSLRVLNHLDLWVVNH